MLPTRKRCVVHLVAANISADTVYILVDLSDTTNFPHVATSEIHVLGLIASIEKDTSGSFDLNFGVVTENDGSNGSAQFFYQLNAEWDSNPTDSVDAKNIAIDFTLGGSNPEGVICAVDTGVTTRFMSNNELSSSVLLQNDVARTTPVGTANPAVGDLVMHLDEITDGGNIDIGVTVIYETA
jgi:hypothetical protein